MEPAQINRKAVLSFRLGLCSLIFGPLTGLPALVLGFLGLRAARRMVGKGKGMAWSGMLAGLTGTLLVSWFAYVMVTEVIWPNEGKRVDRIFKDLERERFYERQDGLWPTFRAIAPEIVYRAALQHWDKDNQYVAVSGWTMRLPSGGDVHRQTLWDCAEPLIAMGKPAVPHLFKWVMHDDLHVRFVATYALGKITGEKGGVGYFDRDESGNGRKASIRRWQEWYDEQQ